MTGQRRRRGRVLSATWATASEPKLASARPRTREVYAQAGQQLARPVAGVALADVVQDLGADGLGPAATISEQVGDRAAGQGEAQQHVLGSPGSGGGARGPGAGPGRGHHGWRGRGCRAWLNAGRRGGRRVALVDGLS
jgi:hypothetical protein